MHKNNIHAWSYCKQSDIILKRYVVNTRLGKINHFSTATKNLKLAVKKNLGLSFDICANMMKKYPFDRHS